jgi:RNA-splicing ligase RtcB
MAAIIPAAVGVDIGCGMNAVRTRLTAEQLPDGLYKPRTDIESVVPAGLLQHSMSKEQGSAAHRAGRALDGGLDRIVAKHPALMKLQRKFNSTWLCQLGTLGGGHHFVELGIIPGSMGTKSYIVRGRGNLQSFCSCSHGAGRRMSRSAAKREFSREDLAAQTLGVECRKDGGVVDEILVAYKDIDSVMANQGDLVEVAHTLKQVLCVKG